MNIIKDYLWYYKSNGLSKIRKLYNQYSVDLSDFIPILEVLNTGSSVPLYKQIFGEDFVSMIPEPLEPRKFGFENEIDVLGNIEKEKILSDLALSSLNKN